jgi:hypothetical protein
MTGNLADQDLVENRLAHAMSVAVRAVLGEWLDETE